MTGLRDYWNQFIEDISAKPVEPVDPEIIKLGTYAMQLGLTEDTMLGNARAANLFQWRMERINKIIADMNREFGWE